VGRCDGKADPRTVDRGSRLRIPGQGAQERSVPVTKGWIAAAPDGGHSNHAGAPLEGAAVALPEDPPEPARGDDAERTLLPSPPDRVLPVPPAGAVLPVAPVPEVPAPEDPAPAAPFVAAVDVGLAVADGVAKRLGDTVEVIAAVPRVTMPPRVTLPGVTAVCARAGKATAVDNSAA
jgi:hypothetical protein